jgi:hypothetical protein
MTVIMFFNIGKYMQHKNLFLVNIYVYDKAVSSFKYCHNTLYVPFKELFSQCNKPMNAHR